MYTDLPNLAPSDDVKKVLEIFICLLDTKSKKVLLRQKRMCVQEKTLDLFHHKKDGRTTKRNIYF